MAARTPDTSAPAPRNLLVTIGEQKAGSFLKGTIKGYQKRDLHPPQTKTMTLCRMMRLQGETIDEVKSEI